MPDKLLLTSFQTWLPHQSSNSSDDLLENIAKRADSERYFWLRKNPVDTELAAAKVIETIAAIKPQGLICCGMAESRMQLSIESNATCDRDCCFTRIDLAELVACTNHTVISHDAGKFVCEGLYYRVLKYLETNGLDIPCVFVHVPRLNEDNSIAIEEDFWTIIDFMKTTRAKSAETTKKID